MIKQTYVLLIVALCSGNAAAQYIRGDEKPVRPEAPTGADDIKTTMPLSEYLATHPDNAPVSPPAPVEDSDPPVLLPIEKLTPPVSETVIVEHAIYRCENGNGVVFVDAESKKQFSKCTLFRAEKTADIVLPPPQAPANSEKSCSGALIYQGKTYIFSADEPCPIPADVFLQRQPVNP